MYHSAHTFTGVYTGLFLGGYFFYKGLNLWWEKRDIQNKPLSKVSGVAMGDAELSGQVIAEKVIQAPFSGLDCVYCSYAVEVPDRNGWRRVDHGQVTSIFYLDDGTGKILVNPAGATYYGPETYHRILTASQFASEPGVSAWINQRRQASIFGSLSEMGQHRFTESIVTSQQPIFVEGAVALTRHVVDQITREEMMVGQRSSGHFVLSAFSQKELLGDFAWKIPLQIFGGSALLLICLWLIVIQLQLEKWIIK